MVCTECEKEKVIFVAHPQDEKQEILICSDCAEILQYEYDEVITGRVIEIEERLCL